MGLLIKNKVYLFFVILKINKRGVMVMIIFYVLL